MSRSDGVPEGVSDTGNTRSDLARLNLRGAVAAAFGALVVIGMVDEGALCEGDEAFGAGEFTLSVRDGCDQFVRVLC